MLYQTDSASGKEIVTECMARRLVWRHQLPPCGKFEIAVTMDVI